MGTKFASPYTNLSGEFLEETILLPAELSKYFYQNNCKLIKELFKKYMDDGFLPEHSTLDLTVLKNGLNNLHPDIKYTVEPVKLDHFSKILIINFLGITILLHKNGYAETDVS